MVRVLEFGDIHSNRTNHSIILESGRQSKLEDCNLSLRQIREIIKKEEVSVVVCTGDLFHGPRPSPDYISEMISFFKSLEEDIVLLIVVAGNHDASPSARYNALQPLESAFSDIPHFHFLYEKNVSAIQFEGLNFICIPHTNEIRVMPANKIEEIISSSEELIQKDKFNILVSHFPINEAIHVFDEGLLLSEDLSFQKIKSTCDKFDLVLLGDIHKQQKVGENIFYAGSILQNTFGEEGDAKSVNIFDINPMKKQYEVHQEQLINRLYKTINLDSIDQLPLYSPNDYIGVVLRVKLQITEVDKLLNFDGAVRNHFSKAFFIVPDFSVVNEQGKILSEISSTTLNDSLQTYVENIFKNDLDLEFIKTECLDILSTRVALNIERESHDT